MDSDDEYDEFGNFIGPEIKQENMPEPTINPTSDAPEDIHMSEPTTSHLTIENALALHVDQAADYETIIVDSLQTGDEQPIIQSQSEQKLYIEYNKTADASDLPETTYSRDYMLSLQKDLPERIRNVAVIGNLHSGKTSFIDKLVMETHPGVSESKRDNQEFKSMRFLDSHKLEKERGISINASLISLLLTNSKQRSHVLNLIDCPGHPDFLDEVSSTLGVVEGAVVVLDLLEGFSKRDKMMVTQLMKRNLPFTILLNKFDRLILELRLPPKDFYLKVKYTLDDVNLFVHHNEYSTTYTHEKLFTPLKNNVIFSSIVLKSTISLKTFAQLYFRQQKIFENLLESQFEMLLWGDIYFNEETGEFSRFDSKKACDLKCTFEVFVLDPIYKLVTYSLTSERDGKELSKLLWDNFSVQLHKSVYKDDPQCLLRIVFSSVFGNTEAFVDSVTQSIPSPDAALQLTKKGLNTDSVSDNLIAEVFKVSLSSDMKEILASVRVFNGTIREGQRIRIIGSHNEVGNNDDCIQEVQQIFLGGGRYKIPVKDAHAGSIVIVSGIGRRIDKCASIFDTSYPSLHVQALHWMQSERRAVYKVAVEPEKPSELPKLVEGLGILSKTYLSAVVNLEESGEHVVLAPGELYMDCFLHDLRYLFDEYFGIKISDPMVRFSETCEERSVTKIDTFSVSRENRIAITSEPLNDKNLSQAIEKGTINLSQPTKFTAKLLRNEFGWDSLAARSLWCFGPDDCQKASILLDDTIEGDTDKDALLAVKDHIISGFQSAINEGPLCDEPIRNCKFKILDAVLSGSKLHSSGSQIIPMTRNAVHTGLMTAGPRLMEPIYRVTITCTYGSIDAVQTILSKRRGWLVNETPIPATKLYEMEGYVPVIDSVGLDTDLRLQTQGQAMCVLELAKWNVVPGDPLDRDCPLPQMKPVPRRSLARDFVLKTRRRKGLSGEPNLQKYLDPEIYAKLSYSGIIN